MSSPSCQVGAHTPQDPAPPTAERRSPGPVHFARRKWGSLWRVILSVLRIDVIRHWFVRLRYVWLRKRIRFVASQSEGIGENTIAHNLSAFKHPGAAFGCGGRMGLLVYPVAAYYSNHVIDKSSLRVLIVGCRTEDDIFWMKAYGFRETYGLDLFSYSRHILLGDIHSTQFESGTFDVVLLGWMISYSSAPRAVMGECLRILKPGGLLGIGIDHNPNQETQGLGCVRVNPLNSTTEIVKMLGTLANYKIVFEYDHENTNDYGAAVVFKILSPPPAAVDHAAPQVPAAPASPT